MDVLIEKGVEAKMRDGTILRADLYRPATDGRYPVLVQRTPYNKDLLALSTLTLDPIRAACGGYAVVIQDVRGRWSSEGDTFYPRRDEFDDGHDTVEWAAGLPCSDGNVGVYGISYMGGATWQAAVTAPPSLRAIVPIEAPNDPIANHLWRGGAFQLGVAASWSLASIGPAALIRAKLGTPDLVPELLRLVDDVDSYNERVRHLPLRTFPAARPDDVSLMPFFFDWLDHPVPDEYGEAISTANRHGEVRVPALIVAGWHDLILGPDLEHFAAMRSSAATEEARDRTKLVIGPWSHGTFLDVVGEVGYGFRANGLFLDLREDLTSLHLRWFDRWLKGIRNGIDEEPPVKLFVQGVNRWRDEEAWPLARAVATPWYLSGDGIGPKAPGAGEEPDSYVYDPEDPCPTRGGAILMPRTYPPGPVDQAPILRRPDVLSYTSDPLAEDLEVTGPVTAVLYAATDARDTDWVVKLCQVLPDGRTLNVCDGILRARYRRGFDAAAPVEPGAVERYEIDLWSTSIVFRAGQRIRVIVTSSDFPRYDRNPNTGELGVDATSTRPARQAIFHDAERASHVLLPIVR